MSATAILALAEVTPDVVDDLCGALFDLSEEVRSEVLSASHADDVADRLDAARAALEWIIGDLADLHRRATYPTP